MSESTKDILVKIPDSDLPKLATLYEKKCVSWAPYMVSFVHTFIKWKKSEKFKNCIDFWSPNNSWHEDGAIVAISSVQNILDVYIFTLNDNNASLYKALMQTTLIDYSKRVIFYGVHEKHIPLLMNYLKDKKISFDVDLHNFIYALSADKAKNLTVDCPSEVYLKKLEPSAAKQINDVWPHKFSNSQNYLADFIEINGGWGVFLKSTDEMVAWVIKHSWGHLSMLQTEEKHKRKGYGNLVATVLSKEIGEEGHWPVGTVVVNNQNSIRMFEKIGFQRLGICRFVEIEPICKSTVI